MNFALVENEYEKNKNLKRDDVAALQEWAKKQPHLPELTELQVILFLHSCYYSNEAAKITIDNYFTARTHCPEFFTNRDVKDNINKELFTILYAPLPEKTHDGCSVFLAKLLDPNPDNYSLTIQIKNFDMMATIYLLEEGTSEGHHVVSDMKGCTLSHIAKLNLMTVKKFFFYLQEAMPVRIKGFHFINIVPFMDKLMSIIRPFMKKELLDVLHLHTDNLETLYQYVPKRCLPKDYGGDGPTVEELARKQKEKYEDPATQSFFKDQEKQIIDESQRPGKPKNAGEIFGMEGTFKKLDID